jgi:hypothetical protein
MNYGWISLSLTCMFYLSCLTEMVDRENCFCFGLARSVLTNYLYGRFLRKKPTDGQYQRLNRLIMSTGVLYKKLVSVWVLWYECRRYNGQLKSAKEFIGVVSIFICPGRWSLLYEEFMWCRAVVGVFFVSLIARQTLPRWKLNIALISKFLFQFEYISI